LREDYRRRQNWRRWGISKKSTRIKPQSTKNYFWLN